MTTTECQIKCESIQRGDMPLERLVTLHTADGQLKQVNVPVTQLNGALLTAHEVPSARLSVQRVLVELPRETVTGDWRVWMHPQDVVRGATPSQGRP